MNCKDRISLGSTIRRAVASKGSDFTRAGRTWQSHELLISHLPPSPFSRFCLAGSDGSRVTIAVHSPVLASNLILQHLIRYTQNPFKSFFNNSFIDTHVSTRNNTMFNISNFQSSATRSESGNVYIDMDIDTAPRQIRVIGWTDDPRVNHFNRANSKKYHLGDFNLTFDTSHQIAHGDG